MKKLFLTILGSIMLLPLVSCKETATSVVDTSEELTVEQPLEKCLFPELERPQAQVQRQVPSDGIIINQTVDSFEKTYKNPLITPKTPNAWPGYGIGDPFVMRWNGKYYLYPSTKDGSSGIQVWSSDDLVSWTYEGLATNETVTAFAPEVVYYNGFFYLYTSPNGDGPFVLKSSSPLGPFEMASGNLDLDIDGDVFIDDDGKWYFYCAGGRGVVAYDMPSPTSMKGATYTGSILGSQSGWTWSEGPMVIKYNDVYYMTYTGNHVWCDGYRINYSVSRDNPKKFNDVGNNPILLNTDRNELFGIGHSSTTIGPDLDSYYICYHSALGAPRRQLNIDRIVLNGDYLGVLGDTFTNQEAPSMPTIYNRFTNDDSLDDFICKDASISNDSLVISQEGYAISKHPFLDNFTAEFNFKSIEDEAGAMFCYKDERNYATACFNVLSQELVVKFIINGKMTTESILIPKSFDEDIDFNALQLLSIKRHDNEFSFFFNNRKAASYEKDMEGGYIGAFSKAGTAKVGFVGINDTSYLESSKTYHKPIEGKLEAITCYESGLETINHNNSEFVVSKEGQTYNYYTNVSKSGTYSLEMVLQCNEPTEVEMYQNGDSIGTITINKSTGVTTECFRNIKLQEGPSVITFKYKSGSADVKSYKFDYTTEVKDTTINYSFTDDNNVYSDGTWTITSGTISLMGAAKKAVGKRLYGEKYWTDYEVEADINLTTAINCGVLVRAKNPSIGGAGDDVALGTDFVQGYFIGLNSSSVVLGKMNYSYTTLTYANIDIQTNSTVNLKVSVIGTAIKVWVNNSFAFEYTDIDNPFLTGMVGIRGNKCNFSVDNLIIKKPQQ